MRLARASFTELNLHHAELLDLVQQMANCEAEDRVTHQRFPFMPDPHFRATRLLVRAFTRAHPNSRFMCALACLCDALLPLCPHMEVQWID